MFDFLLNRKKLLGRHASCSANGASGGARNFSRKKGLKTLTRNYACKAGEIDLIMVDSDRSIVFVEVKTRTDEEFAPTESVITTTKDGQDGTTPHGILFQSTISRIGHTGLTL